MMSFQAKGGWLVWVVSTVVVIALLTRAPEKSSRHHSEPLLPRPEMLKVVGAAHLNLLADYYWIQSIQAVGKAKTADEYRDIYFYADLATTLDPDFDVIYRFAGTSIPFNLGREVWVNTKESSAILEKGLRRFPDELALRILVAFNLSYFDHDYARAAEVLEKATRLPGAPRYLGPLTTRLYAKGGRVESGLELARAMLEIETDPDAKMVYERRIRQLETERVLQQVDQAITSYRQSKGAVPATVIQLIIDGLLPPGLIEPSGGTIFIDEKGVAQTTAEPRLEVKTDALNTGEALPR